MRLTTSFGSGQERVKRRWPVISAGPPPMVVIRGPRLVILYGSLREQVGMCRQIGNLRTKIERKSNERLGIGY